MRLARSPSGDTIGGMWGDAVQTMETSLLRCGCTCGAATQLEQERERLLQVSRNVVGTRLDTLTARETELDRRVRHIEASARELLDHEQNLRERRSELDRRKADVAQSASEIAHREEALVRFETELQHGVEQLEDLQGNAARQEEELARGELNLLEARNSIDDELEYLRKECAVAEARVADLTQHCKDCSRKTEEAEREIDLLRGDQVLLEEVAAQVDPVRCSLVAQEERLVAGEREIAAREADCEERETRLFPEYHQAAEAFRVVEARRREFLAQEEASRRQLQQLLQRQRDLSGSELRLRCMEGALRRRHMLKEDKGLADSHSSNDSASSCSAHAGTTGGGDHESSPEKVERSHVDVEEMRTRLTRLRQGDVEWDAHVRELQADIQRLEARVDSLMMRCESCRGGGHVSVSQRRGGAAAFAAGAAASVGTNAYKPPARLRLSPAPVPASRRV